MLRSKDLRAGEDGDTDFRPVTVEGVDMLVARLKSGQVVAFARRCPHQQTDLDEAYFWDGKVRCPLHNYLYDPRTGENVLPTGDARPENLWKLKPGWLPTWTVEERGGWVYVSTTGNGPPPSYDPALEERPAGGRVAPAPPPSAPEPPPAVVTHDAQRLQLAVGAEIDLRLPTVVKPGHTWRVVATPGLLSVLEERWDPADPPAHRVRVAGAQAGEATLWCAYARPWDTEPAEVRTYTVSVTPAV